MRKVALVTGSSRGIGASTVLEFAKNGYDVVIHYQKEEKLAYNLKEKIEATYPVKALVCQADISKEDEVKKMMDLIQEEYGHIDCLVNNAGIAIDTFFEDKTIENFRKILDVNLIGTFLVSKYASKYMNQGTIIMVSSTNGIDTTYPESLDYDASKAGVISLMKNLAHQFAPNIRVNCVAPGWVKTDMNQCLEPEFVKTEESKILLNRFAEPEEIAKVIYFLASEDARYINNTVIRVDGGCK